MKQQTLQAHKQHGSTIVGFVVGLLVGLGIALSVAVYVTRVPVPFVDRGVSRKPAQDVEEAERNQGWNPNAGLAGSPATLPPPVVSPEPAPASAVAEPADSPAATTTEPAADKPAACTACSWAAPNWPGFSVRSIDACTMARSRALVPAPWGSVNTW